MRRLAETILKGSKVVRKFIGICFLAVLGATVVRANNENGFHVFTDQKGQTFEAVIKQVDLEGRRIQIERKDNAVAWVGVDLLGRSELTYITKWYNAWRLLRDDALRISVKQESEKGRISRLEDDEWVRKTPHKATLTLEKLNNSVIKEIHIEYCFYIARSATAEESAMRREIGTIDVGTLAVKTDQVVNTGEVVLNSEFAVMNDTSSFGSSNNEILKSEEQIIGVWFRVCGSGEDGVLAVRDICVPEDLSKKVKWKYTSAEEKDADRELTRPASGDGEE